MSRISDFFSMHKRAAAIIVSAAAVLLLACAWLFFTFRQFSSWTVNNELELSNADGSQDYLDYADGYVKCGSDGVTYFTGSGIVWTEATSFLQPLADSEGDYIAVAEAGSRYVYLYDKSGYVNKLSMNHDITDVHVSNAAMVAASTNEGNACYIEVKDMDGNEILTSKSIFSSNGYIMDLALSPDGMKMAAAFVKVVDGSLASKVVLYDLSRGAGEENIISAQFDDYDGSMITMLEFMNGNTVCAIADNAVTFLGFTDNPYVINDIRDFNWTIDTAAVNKEYLALLVEDPELQSDTIIKIFDHQGHEILEKSTDFIYTKAELAGPCILLYSNSSCQMINILGVIKWMDSFDSHVEVMRSKDGIHFVVGGNVMTQFITLR